MMVQAKAMSVFENILKQTYQEVFDLDCEDDTGKCCNRGQIRATCPLLQA
jgi:hypothetical protein